MAEPAKQKDAAPANGPPPPYTPMSNGHSYMYTSQIPPSVLHPNVRISPNVIIHDPSRVKINGMPLTTAYPPQMVGTTTFGPGYQQTTGFVAGTGFHSMQSIQSSGPGQMQQSVVIPGTGVVISQNFPGGPAGPPGAYQY